MLFYIAAVLAQGYDLGCGVPAAKNVCLHAAAVVACWGYLVSYFPQLVWPLIGAINLSGPCYISPSSGYKVAPYSPFSPCLQGLP